MKIALLSCFHPFRGGIAQFNANLFTELSKEHDVKAFNFKRQYPSILFPGKTQYVTPDDKAVPVESQALLDTVNPFSWERTAREIRKYDPDVLIMRYWMSWFAPSLGYVARRMKPGCKVIAILDNVIPHEPHFFDRPLTKYFLSGVDGCVTLCAEVGNDLLDIKPAAVHAVIPHPVSTQFGERIPREEAEKTLSLESGKKNILFFGLIREYKGLDILIEAFNSLDDSYQLIIAGEPYGSFEKYQKLIDVNSNRERIHVFPEYIGDSDVKTYFSAADVVVLPYRSATQSGVSAASNHFEIPMIVTDVGGLRETIGERGTGIVCSKPEPDCISKEIVCYFGDPKLRESFVSAIRKENDRLSWSRFSASLMGFADTLK